MFIRISKGLNPVPSLSSIFNTLQKTDITFDFSAFTDFTNALANFTIDKPNDLNIINWLAYIGSYIPKSIYAFATLITSTIQFLLNFFENLLTIIKAILLLLNSTY